MRKLYEIFKILQIQKRILSAETIRGNTVFFMKQIIRFGLESGKKQKFLLINVFLESKIG